MGDNKISEATALAASLRQIADAQYTRRQRFNGRLPADVQEVLRMAADHLQGEAVPDKGPWEVCAGEPGSLISDDFTHDVMLRVHGDFDSDEALANYCKWLVSRLNHPQPAELSEVSGLAPEQCPDCGRRTFHNHPDGHICLHCKLIIGAGKNTEFALDALVAAGHVEQSKVDQALAIGAALAATGKQQRGEALTDTYVQAVPDKCDRIAWRVHYYHLPIKQAGEVQANQVQPVAHSDSQWIK